MSDKEKFDFLLKNKDKFKVFIDNDAVFFADKKDLEYAEEDFTYEYDVFEFDRYGYELIQEIMKYFGVDAELV